MPQWANLSVPLLSLDPWAMAQFYFQAMPVKAWQSQRISGSWLAGSKAESVAGKEFQDQLNKASEEDRGEIWRAMVGAIRREEIVMAACFAEAFLFEDVCDYVFRSPRNANLDEFRVFILDPKEKSLWDERDFKKRWKKTVQALWDQGRFTDPGNLFRESKAWSSLIQLMHFRNNLVHTNVGLPGESWDEDRMYEPSPSKLAECAPGWATAVALDVARGVPCS